MHWFQDALLSHSLYLSTSIHRRSNYQDRQMFIISSIISYLLIVDHHWLLFLLSYFMNFIPPHSTILPCMEHVEFAPLAEAMYRGGGWSVLRNLRSWCHERTFLRFYMHALLPWGMPPPLRLAVAVFTSANSLCLRSECFGGEHASLACLYWPVLPHTLCIHLHTSCSYDHPPPLLWSLASWDSTLLWIYPVLAIPPFLLQVVTNSEPGGWH